MRVLHIEDDAGETLRLRDALRAGPSPWRDDPVAATSLGAALTALRKGKFDIVVIDLGLPDSQGLATFRAVRQAVPHVPTVLVTNPADEALALESLREGAHDYLVKGQYGDIQRVLRHSVARASVQTQRHDERRKARGAERPGKVRLVHVEPGEHLGALAAHARRLEVQGNLIVLATVERTVHLLREALQKEGVRLSSVIFVDATGLIEPAPAAGVLAAGSAKDTDVLALRMEQACGQLGLQVHAVLDSLNGLARQAGTERTLQFAHFVGNRMRALGAGLDLVVVDDANGRSMTPAVANLVDTVVGAVPTPRPGAGTTAWPRPPASSVGNG